MTCHQYEISRVVHESDVISLGNQCWHDEMSPLFSSCNNGDDQSCCFGLGTVPLQYVVIGSKSDHHDKSLGVMEVLIVMVLTLNSSVFL